MIDLASELSAATTEVPDEYDGVEMTVPYSRIPPIPATSLWEGVVPNRTPTFVVAPGGTGKGILIAKIIAMTTTGEAFPGALQGREPGSVIIVAPEDDANEDMAFRLRAADADLGLVRDLTVLPNGSPFLLPSNIPELQRAISEINDEGGPPVKLIALDPLMAIAENGLDSKRAALGVILPLQDIAREYGGAMILSHHTTKNENVVAGSKVLTNAARLVWMISRAPDDASIREMTVWKTNRPATGTVRYRIEGDGQDVRAVFIPPNSAVPGSRAARLRLTGSPVERAQQWLAEHPPKTADSEEKAA